MDVRSTTLRCAALLTVVACSGSSGGTAGPAGARPTVAGLTVATGQSGTVAVTFSLVDADSATADVTLEVSLDGGVTWRLLTLASGSTTALGASAAGTAHTVQWNTLADLGFRKPSDALLRATATDEGAAGSPTDATVPSIDNLPLALSRVESYMIHYGSFDAAAMEMAQSYDLVILHPVVGELTVDTVRDIMDGVDAADPADDVIVLAYVSVGEDARTTGLTDAQMLADSRFVGDGTGPRVDPRGPNADGSALTGIDPLGSASPGGTGFASWYLDDNSVDNDVSDIGDGLPDRNSAFGGCFVNAGDPKWFDALDQMQFDGVDGVPGMRELLTTDYGRGYGCDGLFLDTIDTCAPNSFTDGSSANQSEFEWTAPGFTAFMQRLDAAYPEKLLLQNRGLFLFDPRFPHYAVTPRASVDLVMVESYRLDSSSAQAFDPYFFPDNKFNSAPKLMAEAGRADGFQVVSLGYAEGPGIAYGTLRGESTAGLATLAADITEAELLAGFRHYLTSGPVNYPNTFVRDRDLPTDTTPPTWTSTYNANTFSFPTPPNAPTARVGIQDLEVGPECATVRWDVALDRNAVGYALYTSTSAFDFVNDPTLTNATRTVLTPSVGTGYAAGSGPTTYPYEQTILSLTTGTTYWFCIRAFDALGNEDTNQVVLSGTPNSPSALVVDGVFDEWASRPIAHTDPADVVASAGPDWREIQIDDDGTHLFIRFTSDDAFNLDGSPTYGFSRTFVFFDLDENPATGWPVGSVGSDMMVSGSGLFEQSASTFNVGSLGTIAVLPVTNVTECELAVPISQILALNPSATVIRVQCLNDELSDFAPDSGYITHTLR